MRGVSQSAVEIDNGVELAAVAYPFVDFAAHGILGRRIIARERGAMKRAFEGQQGAADDPDLPRVRGGDQLSVAGNHRRSGGRWRAWRKGAAGPADIVDAEQDDHSVHARLRQDIVREARRGPLAHAVR